MKRLREKLGEMQGTIDMLSGKLSDVYRGEHKTDFNEAMGDAVRNLCEDILKVRDGKAPSFSNEFLRQYRGAQEEKEDDELSQHQSQKVSFRSALKKDDEEAEAQGHDQYQGMKFPPTIEYSELNSAP